MPILPWTPRLRSRNLPPSPQDQHRVSILRNYNSDERLDFILKHDAVYFSLVNSHLNPSSRSNLTSYIQLSHEPIPPTLIEDARSLSNSLHVAFPGSEHSGNRDRMSDHILTSSSSSEIFLHGWKSPRRFMTSEGNRQNAGALRLSDFQYSGAAEEEYKPEISSFERDVTGGASSTAHQTALGANISTPERPEGWGSDYYERPASNIPQYESPGRADVATNIQPTMNRKLGAFGAFQPSNTLGATQNSAKPEKREKPFNYTYAESPAKRPKLSGKLLSRQQSSGKTAVYVDLDGDESSTQSLDRRSQDRPAPRQHLPPSEIGSNVKEYKHVETIVGFAGKKKSYPRRSGYDCQNERNVFSRDTASQQSSDSDVMETERPQQTAQVSTGYKGTSNRRPARPAAERYRQRRRSLSNSMRSSTTSAERSSHFQVAGTQDSQNVRRVSTASLYNFSRSMPETQPSQRNGEDIYQPQPLRLGSEVSLLDDAPDSKPESRPIQQDPVTHEDEDSTDIISADHSPEEMRAKKSPSIMAPFQRQKQLGDIVPTQFINRTKSHTVANSGARRQMQKSSIFTIAYALAGTREMPCSALRNSPRLERDLSNIWRPFGEELEESDFPELTIRPDTIHRIIYSEDSSKVIIHRATSTHPQISKILCLELRESLGARLVQEILSLNSLGITVQVQDSFRLDQIFEKQKMISSHKLTHHGVNGNKVAEEIQPLENGKRRQTELQLMNNIEIRTQVGDTESQNLQRKYPEPHIQRIQKASNLNLEDPFAEVSDNQATEKSRGRGLLTRSTIHLRQPTRTPTPEPIKWTAQNPEWKKSWVGPQALELQYPFDDRNKAVVSIDDIYRLDENEMLNDNLVVFYLRVLEYNLQKSRPDLARRIYFNNSFFYNTLTGSGRSGKGKGIFYEAVQRWTSRVNIFSYDYIIVPVCEETHWYVAIICNAPRMINDEVKLVDDEKSSAILEGKGGAEMPQKPTESDDSSSIDIGPLNISSRPTKGSPSDINEDAREAGAKSTSENEDTIKASTTADTKKSKRRVPTLRKHNPKDPRIITLDSLNFSRSPACTNLKNWLIAEAKAKLGHDIDIDRLGLTAKGLPEQENNTDCGVFLLAYIEQFLKDPDAFVCDILEGKRDLEKNWEGWTARRIPNLRHEMRDMIFKFRREFIEIRKQERAKRKRRTQKEEGAQVVAFQATALQSPNHHVSPEALPSKPEKPEVPSSDSGRTLPVDKPKSTTDIPVKDHKVQQEPSPKQPLGQRLAQDVRISKERADISLRTPCVSRAPKSSLSHRLADKVRRVRQNAIKALNGIDCQKQKEKAYEIMETPDPDSRSRILTPSPKKRPNAPRNESADTTLSGILIGSAPDSPLLLDCDDDDSTDFVSTLDVPGSMKSPLQVDDSQESITTHMVKRSLALQKKTYSSGSDGLRLSHSSPVQSPNRQRVNIDAPFVRPGSSRIIKRDRNGHPVTPNRTAHRDEIAISPPRSPQFDTQSNSPIAASSSHKKSRYNDAIQPFNIIDS